MNAKQRYALYTCRNLLILNKLDLLHKNLIYILLCKYFTYIQEANTLRSNTSCRLQVPLVTIPGAVAETKRAEWRSISSRISFTNQSKIDQYEKILYRPMNGCNWLVRWWIVSKYFIVPYIINDCSLRTLSMLFNSNIVHVLATLSVWLYLHMWDFPNYNWNKQ